MHTSQHNFIKRIIRWMELLNREWFIFLFLLLLSATFWFTVTLSEDKNIDVSIPIQIVNVPENVVFIDNNPDTVTVNIRGEGRGLMQYLLFEKGDTIDIPFSRFNKSSGEISISNAEFLKLMKYEGGDATIQLTKRDGLVYHYCFVSNYKKVPVRIRGNVVDISDIEIFVKPDSVRVYAQQPTLDQIEEVFIEDINLKNEYKGDSLVLDKKLQMVRGVKMEPQYVKVFVNPVYYIDKEIEVPITCVNEPENIKVRIFPSKAKVKCQVNMAQYNSVDETMFAVVLDYNNIQESKSNCPLTITRKPTNVRNAVLVTKVAEPLIERIR